MSRRGWILFATMSVIWGIPYLMIKVAVEELAPATLVLFRCGIATVLLLPIALLRGQVRPLLPRWKPLLAYTAGGDLRAVAAARVRRAAAVQLADRAAHRRGAAGRRAAGPVRPGPGAARRPPADAGCWSALAGVAALVGFEAGAGDARAIVAVALTVIGYALGPAILSRTLSDLPVARAWSRPRWRSRP